MATQTLAELAAYYANLLIMQYAGKPRAAATIEALTSLVLMPQSGTPDPILPFALQDGFNLTGDNTAVGAQLDILGKYANVTRHGKDTVEPITLGDADFLSLIRMAIAISSSQSDLASIQQFMATYFPGQIFVFDYANMRMSYLISSAVGSQDLIQVLISQKLLPRPMGVQLGVIYADEIDKFFGYRTYAHAAVNSTPLNSYADYSMESPWLSYGDSVTVPS